MILFEYYFLPRFGKLERVQDYLLHPPFFKKKKIEGVSEDIKPCSLYIVLEANSLMGKDRSGSSDPYVSLTLGKTKYKTAVVSRCLEPKWDEKFELYDEEGRGEMNPRE